MRIKVKIIDNLLSSLNYSYQVKDIRQGPFQTAVVTRNCGLASTPHDAGPHHDKTPVTDAGRLLGKDAVSGTKVIDSEMVLRCVSQGATFRQISGIELLTMRKDS
jgi:hypothetical protein